jgi:hypothetical protein
MLRLATRRSARAPSSFRRLSSGAWSCSATAGNLQAMAENSHYEQARVGGGDDRFRAHPGRAEHARRPEGVSCSELCDPPTVLAKLGAAGDDQAELARHAARRLETESPTGPAEVGRSCRDVVIPTGARRGPASASPAAPSLRVRRLEAPSRCRYRPRAAPRRRGERARASTSRRGCLDPSLTYR